MSKPTVKIRIESSNKICDNTLNVNFSLVANLKNNSLHKI